VDLDYNGIQNDFPEMEPIVPFRKRRPARGHKSVKAKPLIPYHKMFNRVIKGDGGRRAYDIKDEEVPNHGRGVQIKVEVLRPDDRHSLRAGQPLDNGHALVRAVATKTSNSINQDDSHPQV